MKPTRPRPCLPCATVLILCLSVVPAVLRSAPPIRPSPSPSAADDAPITYRKVLSAIKARQPEEGVDSLAFSFGVLGGQTWPRVSVREIRTTPRGRVLLVDGDQREYRVGDAIQGALVIEIVVGSATLELGGQTRRFFSRKAFPEVVPRSIRQIEGEWAVFFEGERRAFYTGDAYRESRVVRIEPEAVTIQFGPETRRLSPRPAKKQFPPIVFTGIIEMAGGRVALVRDRPDPLRVGDTFEGARIIDIQPTQVVLEFEGERRAVPIR